MNPANRLRSCLLPVYFLAAVLVMTGCKAWSERGAKGVGLLPKAPAGEQHFSSYVPRNPYSKLASGIMTRTLFETSSGNGYHVEVRDLLVGPGQHSESVSLPGAAVFEVRSGGGVMTVSGTAQELKLGSTLTFPEGQAFTIENKTDSALAMRVHLFRAE